MRKLLVIFVILLLGFTLASCASDDNDPNPNQNVTTEENPGLITDLIDGIKGVFGD